jgi:DNA polymerase III alpha subunit
MLSTANKIKIKSVKSLGKREVYDIEMPTAHNFVLDSGVVAHNCSHAVSYVHISYACAFLKHHYPLQWWTAVLRNANKNEIGEKFWPHCGHMIKMPDVQHATDNFTIVGEQIQAPLSLLQGIGATAHQELVEVCANAKNITEFFVNVYDRRVRNGKDGKLGRSALSRKVVYTLIVSGSMDSLFDVDTTILDKLMQYEAARAAYEDFGKKKTARSKPKKAKPVDPSYVDLNEIQIYQLRKSILSSYSQNMINLVKDHKLVVQTAVGYGYKYGNKIFKLVDSKDILRYEETGIPNGELMNVAVPCYVQADERITYGAEKKQMAKLTLDCNGTVQYVAWPERGERALTNGLESDLTGSVGIAILHKYSKEKPFTVIGFEVVQQPFEMAKEESNE